MVMMYYAITSNKISKHQVRADIPILWVHFLFSVIFMELMKMVLRNLRMILLLSLNFSSFFNFFEDFAQT